jgi:hypothetical protein
MNTLARAIAVVAALSLPPAVLGAEPAWLQDPLHREIARRLNGVSAIDVHTHLLDLVISSSPPAAAGCRSTSIPRTAGRRSCASRTRTCATWSRCSPNPRKYLLLAPEKVLFGTDSGPYPGVPGGPEVQLRALATATREALYLALAGLVRDGVVDLETATGLGRGVLRGNAARLHGWE